MKSISIHFRKLYRAACLALALGLAVGASAAPSIQSITPSPNPFITGQSFALTVAASTDVTQAIAMVQFRPGAVDLLQIPLAKQGAVWTGTGVVPPDIAKAVPFGAMVRVMVFNAL